MKPLELYIHIPFCKQKCNYCDFLSAPCGQEEREAYVVSLCEQIRQYDELARAYHVVSIFFGGGTPSLLEQESICKIMETVKSVFTIDADAEITMECNPGTLDWDKLHTYKAIGINRLSLGLQSVHDEELKMLGRIHTYEEFEQSFFMARATGFANINVDLISAIPHQTCDGWQETLRIVAELKPEHISAYSLIIEEGTPFFKLYGEGRNEEDLPSEEEERQMYEDTKRILETFGYERYEISNYAMPGFACRHNMGYWERCEYLGFGTGAASLIGNKRWTNGITRETMSEKTEEVLSVGNQMEEFLFLGLRMCKGISRNQFEATFGKTLDSVYGDVIQRYVELGMLTDDGEWVSFTEKGISVSNAILSEFLLDEEER